jgi:hypothetical protein
MEEQMSTEAYLSITAQTLWEETGVQNLSVDELIADARRILDELEQRSFSPLHFPGDSCYENDVIVREVGSSKRRSFLPMEGEVKPTNHGRAWTDDQIEQAKAFKVAGWSNSKIARQFGRNTNGVRKMLRRK